MSSAPHQVTIDHMPTASRYQRLNKRVAQGITSRVGTMTCFWVFCLLALCSLPAILSMFQAFRTLFPHWLVSASLISLVAWVSSNFLQLVLLPSIMVGQNLQSAAADARARKTFDDVEEVLDRLDTGTQGGLREILDAVNALRSTA